MKSQTDIIDSFTSAGVVKTTYPFTQLIVRAAMAGAFIALGGLLSVVASAGFADNASLQKIVSGLTFPIGLLLTVIFGSELFTGNCAVLVPGVASRRVSYKSLFTNWTLVWLGNFIGALIIVGIMGIGSGTLDNEPFASAITKIAAAKSSLAPSPAFWRAIGCNWLVCLGVWLAMCGDTLPAKALGCWIPVGAFVILGFEHCVANMFFIPAGMLLSDVGIDLAALMHNLIPVTIGNIVGGTLFVGMLNTWLYSKTPSRK